jgi:hypothetical protein
MADAIDGRTALVAVSLVSNVNGRIEKVAELSRTGSRRDDVIAVVVVRRTKGAEARPHAALVVIGQVIRARPRDERIHVVVSRNAVWFMMSVEPSPFWWCRSNA